MQKENPAIVPNFIPNNLPRSDRGDREYYCCTMMTLFKPWRTGKDLKEELQSWDDSFTKYKFSKRQLEIMKYFNLRYECLDARDDFSAKCKKGDIDNLQYSWADCDTFTLLDDMYNNDNLFNGDDFQMDQNAYDDEENLSFKHLDILVKKEMMQ